MSKEKLAQIFHFSLQGKREYKYDFLNENSLSSIAWKELTPTKPNFFFVEKDFEGSNEFEKYIDLRLLFSVNSMGIATGNDDELVSFDKFKIIEKFNSASNFYYRPFDIRYTIFDNSILQRARFKLMNNYVIGDNLGLNIIRQSKGKGIETLITNNLTNRDFITNHTYNFPLYLYPEKNDQQSIHTPMGHDPLESKDPLERERVPNLNMEIVNKIAESFGLSFVAETPMGHDPLETKSVFSPMDLLDYIYAVLHSPTYREKYKEFLKIDFPRVPYPMGHDPLEKSMIGRVYINKTQYFDNVPQVAWEFYIGGYQPAQKWLKDRKDRKLKFEDILHYQKIIVALAETDRLMREIDEVGVM